MIKILFQGDSITDCNRDRANPNCLGAGYPRKVADVFSTLYPSIPVTFLNRGISGNRVIDLLERYEDDFLDLAPDVISILIGINDTWRRYDSNDLTTVEQFKTNYELLLSKIRQDMPKTKIIIMEPFLLNTMEDRVLWREDLNPKITVIRELARKYANAYVALDGLLQQHIVGGHSDADVAADAVHPTDVGHGIIAAEYLRVLSGLVRT